MRAMAAEPFGVEYVRPMAMVKAFDDQRYPIFLELLNMSIDVRRTGRHTTQVKEIGIVADNGVDIPVFARNWVHGYR